MLDFCIDFLFNFLFWFVFDFRTFQNRCLFLVYTFFGSACYVFFRFRLAIFNAFFLLQIMAHKFLHIIFCFLTCILNFLSRSIVPHVS